MRLRLIKISKQYAWFLVVLIIIFLLAKFGLGIPCPIHTVTGLYCPGCGATRMIINILNLDFKNAFLSNQCLFFILPATFILIAIDGIKFIITGEYGTSKLSNIIFISFIVVLIIFGILRNIPAFHFLQPV